MNDLELRHQLVNRQVGQLGDFKCYTRTHQLIDVEPTFLVQLHPNDFGLMPENKTQEFTCRYEIFIGFHESYFKRL